MQGIARRDQSFLFHLVDQPCHRKCRFRLAQPGQCQHSILIDLATLAYVASWCRLQGMQLSATFIIQGNPAPNGAGGKPGPAGIRNVPALPALLLNQSAKFSMVKTGCPHQVTDDPEAKQGHLLAFFVRHADLLQGEMGIHRETPVSSSGDVWQRDTTVGWRAGTVIVTVK